MSALLEARQVSKVFGGGLFAKRVTVALDHFSFSIDSSPPTITAIVGESGSGKTTLARLLLGLASPTTGEVLYEGTDIRRLAGEGLGRRPRFVPMPVGVARGVLRAAKWVARLAGLSIVSSSAIDFISEDNPFSSDRARRELGWAPTVRPEEGVPDAFRWWKEQQ